MPEELLCSLTCSITDLKKNPMIEAVVKDKEVVAILNNNKVAYYCVPPETYKEMPGVVVPEPYTSPEQNDDNYRVAEQIREIVRKAMNIHRNVRIFIAGSDDKHVTDMMCCDIMPVIARLKLIKQYYFEFREIGYHPSEEDLNQATVHWEDFYRTPFIDFSSIYMKHNVFCDGHTPESIRKTILQEIVRLIEDREWFLHLQKGVYRVQ